MDIGERIYVEFSPELKSRLNHRINLREVLRAAGIEAEVEWHAVPPTDPDERSKALVETVTAVSIGALSLAAAIKIIESAITHYLNNRAVRDSHYRRAVNEPLLDGKGRPVLDDEGRPLLIARPVSGFDTLTAVPGGGVTISAGLLSASIGADDDQTASARTKVIKVTKDR